MSLFRHLLVVLAAISLASMAVAANDTSSATSNHDASAQTQEASQPASQATNNNEEASNKLNINTATAKDLMKVKGLNAAKAKAIIVYRKKHGDFKSLDDLKEVKGFKRLKDKAFQSIEDQLTVG